MYFHIPSWLDVSFLLEQVQRLFPIWQIADKTNLGESPEWPQISLYVCPIKMGFDKLDSLLDSHGNDHWFKQGHHPWEKQP